MDCTLIQFSKTKYFRVLLILLLVIAPWYYAYFGSECVHPAMSRFNVSISKEDTHITNASLTSKSHTPLSTKAPKKIVYPDKSEFSVTISMEDAVLLQQMLRVFDAAMKSVNVSYFIIGGTLLGSYRNHGQIPWDDDADVIFNNSDASTVKQVLSKFDPRFHLYVPKQSSQFFYTKYHPTNGHQVKDAPYRTPYLDIYVYEENETHLLNMASYFHKEIFAKRYVFPLVQRPYGELSLPAPCNPRAVMEAIGIDVSMCRRSALDHITEVVSKAAEIPCTLLAESYPFVHRGSTTNVTDAKVIETLVLGKLVLRQVSIEGVCWLHAEPIRIIYKVRPSMEEPVLSTVTDFWRIELKVFWHKIA